MDLYYNTEPSVRYFKLIAQKERNLCSENWQTEPAGETKFSNK